MVQLIVACEVGFWVLLASGLLARYGLGWRRTSTALLVGVPVVDVVLLVATVVDLRGGGTASTAHALAAFYLGFSVAFGHRTIARVDAWAAHRFAGGPEPVRPSARGPARVAREWAEWRRALLAGGVAAVVLGLCVAVVGGAADTSALTGSLLWIPIVLSIWLVTGPLWTAVKERGGTRGSDGGPAVRPAPGPTAPRRR